MKYPEMSDLDLGKTILMSLGDTEEFIATLPEEKIIEAIGYTSVVKTESFFKQTADGEKIEISENDYYTEIANIKVNSQADTEEMLTATNDSSVLATAMSSPVYDNPEILDSYVKLTSTAYKTNPSYAVVGRNYFTIRGEVEWTKTPFVKERTFWHLQVPVMSMRSIMRMHVRIGRIFQVDSMILPT